MKPRSIREQNRARDFFFMRPAANLAILEHPDRARSSFVAPPVIMVACASARGRHALQNTQERYLGCSPETAAWRSPPLQPALATQFSIYSSCLRDSGMLGLHVSTSDSVAEVSAAASSLGDGAGIATWRP